MAETRNNDKAKEEILLSKRMFFAGCLGLPWLWICNALYFRLRVFGPLVLVDYWPGHFPTPPSDNNSHDRDNASGSSDQQQAAEAQLELEVDQKELVKWVTRSVWGAFIVMPLFVAWIISFQVLKDSFGPQWFVMDETDFEVTGW